MYSKLWLVPLIVSAVTIDFFRVWAFLFLIGTILNVTTTIYNEKCNWDCSRNTVSVMLRWVATASSARLPFLQPPAIESSSGCAFIPFGFITLAFRRKLAGSFGIGPDQAQFTAIIRHCFPFIISPPLLLFTRERCVRLSGAGLFKSMCRIRRSGCSSAEN